jgi:hypothetical protein
MASSRWASAWKAAIAWGGLGDFLAGAGFGIKP